MATVRFSQAAKRGRQDVGLSYLPAVVVVTHLMTHVHCCLRCEATTLILLYVLYRKEASGFFLCLNVKRDEHDSHYLLYECVSGTSTTKDKSYKKQYFEQTLHPYFLFLLLSLFAYTTHTLYVYDRVLCTMS